MIILLNSEEWEALLNKLKDKYPSLKKEDPKYIAGKEEELMQKLERILAMKRGELLSLIIRERSAFHSARMQKEAMERLKTDPEHPNEPVPDVAPDIID